MKQSERSQHSQEMKNNSAEREKQKKKSERKWVAVVALSLLPNIRGGG